MDDATRCKIARGVVRKVLGREDIDAEHLAEQTAREMADPRNIAVAVRRAVGKFLRRPTLPTEPIYERADLPDRGEYAVLAREAIDSVPEGDREIARRIVEDFETNTEIARALGGNYSHTMARVRNVRERLQEVYAHG